MVRLETDSLLQFYWAITMSMLLAHADLGSTHVTQCKSHLPYFSFDVQPFDRLFLGTNFVTVSHW